MTAEEIVMLEKQMRCYQSKDEKHCLSCSIKQQIYCDEQHCEDTADILEQFIRQQTEIAEKQRLIKQQAQELFRRDELLRKQENEIDRLTARSTEAMELLGLAVSDLQNLMQEVDFGLCCVLCKVHCGTNFTRCEPKWKYTARYEALKAQEADTV